MNNLVDAGNLLYPAREAIEKLGYVYKEEFVSDFNNKLYCEASNEQITLHADSPLKILGLIKLVEVFGPRPWEK